ncbi:MAG: hypothetical protein O2819_04600 [Planctomycetota bacterium]|nr:hypothetical protein [Planctomycetota bacterium]MDA1105117.1 hypothetical protein [Planctomycetota bacterium]
MSAHGAKAKLQLALKDFETKWHQLSEVWDDPASRGLNAKYIDPLHDRIRQAIAALEKISEVQLKARRECTPES